MLYYFEKWLYAHADAIVFTMEGGKDYIIEQGWDTDYGGIVREEFQGVLQQEVGVK